MLARDFNVSDLSLAAAAFESVLAYVDDDASRCAWERVYAGLLLKRVADAVSYQRQVDEMDEAMGGSAPSGPDLSSMEAETEHLSSRWRRGPETVVARVLTLDLRRPVAAADLAELKRVAASARNHCGWAQ